MFLLTKALLSSKNLNLLAKWQGMTAETIAQNNGYKNIVTILQVKKMK